ncbi:UDP-N-acetylglucosamine 1-carboxyvinyltransferase [Streptomyces sp. NPDC088757]|uniref:UDP-N-acetylglucosamine 1-carboxyvinyltransferase n=1 Tax=Streptomyces sp. NPDC088757 TaxID=3365889 RepID=UPI00381B28B9
MTTAATSLHHQVLHVTGGRPLSGRIQVQGGKNIALHLYAAALLADQPLVLHQAPGILDTGVCAAILTRAGTDTRVRGDRFEVSPAAALRPVVDRELGAKVRTTAVLAAAVLARAGRVGFPAPGGDAFCSRLIDRHLAAMEAAGAKVTVDEQGRSLSAVCAPGGLRAFRTDAATDYGPSLGATVTALLLAARAPGTSLIVNPSIEPEVTETARFLAERGVRTLWDDEGLHVRGTDRIAGGAFTIAGDRIEAATMIAVAAATGGGVELDGITPAELPGGLRHALTAAGVILSDRPGGLAAATGPDGLHGADVRTGPHPGLPTDTAPQLGALLTLARGTSSVLETVYPRRDTHVEGLRALGANITSSGQLVSICGVPRLRPAAVRAADIRAVTALLIAALTAEGTSTIGGMYHLARGYGRLLPNLGALGADITTHAEAP